MQLSRLVVTSCSITAFVCLSWCNAMMVAMVMRVWGVRSVVPQLKAFLEVPVFKFVCYLVVLKRCRCIEWKWWKCRWFGGSLSFGIKDTISLTDIALLSQHVHGGTAHAQFYAQNLFFCSCTVSFSNADTHPPVYCEAGRISNAVKPTMTQSGLNASSSDLPPLYLAYSVADSHPKYKISLPLCIIIIIVCWCQEGCPFDWRFST